SLSQAFPPDRDLLAAIPDSLHPVFLHSLAPPFVPFRLASVAGQCERRNRRNTRPALRGLIKPPQELSRMRTLHARNLLWRPLRHNLAAILAAFRPQVD